MGARSHADVGLLAGVLLRLSRRGDASAPRNEPDLPGQDSFRAPAALTPQQALPRYRFFPALVGSILCVP